jgi:hypothetical protein
MWEVSQGVPFADSRTVAALPMKRTQASVVSAGHIDDRELRDDRTA